VLNIQSLPIRTVGHRQRFARFLVEQASDARLDIARFGGAAIADDGELAASLAAWHSGDAGPMCQLLDEAWSLLGAGPKAVGDLAVLADALQALGVERAMPEAIDALIYGDAAEVVEHAVKRWIGARLAPFADGGAAMQARGLNALLLDLLSGASGLPPMKPPVSDSQILQRLHEYLQDSGPPGDEPAAERWHTLELQRFALASATTLQPDSKPDPAALVVANKALLTAFKVEQAALGERIAAIQAGKPLPDLDPERDDVTYGLFEELATQCDRLGLRLKLPEPAACRRALRSGESLVQVWFDGVGQAHALILSGADPALTDRALPASLNLDAWTPLLDQWDASRVMPGAAWDGSPALYEVYATQNANAEPYGAAQAAWNRFVGADSPASALLAELLQAVPGQTMSLILPAPLARLPWLARAVSGTNPERADFEPGRIVLEPSVSSWLMARQAQISEQEVVAPSDAVGLAVYTPVPLQVVLNRVGTVAIPFGQIEASTVGAALGAQVAVAEGPVQLLQALQAPGPAHLCLHGTYEPFEPMNSSLGLGDADKVLPLWLLQGTQVQGDVSLSACQAMLVGSAHHSPWAGPVGIGPLLRARGARSVLGPLGKSNALASWMFYELWFQARRALPAVRALAQTQQRLREMTLQQARQRIATVADATQRQALDQILMRLAPDGGGPPFAHPAMWTQFVLLGDAPALHSMQATQTPQKTIANPLRRLWMWVSARVRRH
jgi:hypothetical protein